MTYISVQRELGIKLIENIMKQPIIFCNTIQEQLDLGEIIEAPSQKDLENFKQFHSQTLTDEQAEELFRIIYNIEPTAKLDEFKRG